MRRVCLAVAALLVSLPALAQIVAVDSAVVMTRDVRLGTFTSASRDVPADIQQTKIKVQANLSNADLVDPNTDMDIRAERSDDNGTTWRTVGSVHYIGCDCPGRNGTPQQQPGVQFDASEVRGAKLRVVLDVRARGVSTGATIAFIP